MRSYVVFLSIASLVTAQEPESILGKRGRPVYFEDEKPTRSLEYVEDEEDEYDMNPFGVVGEQPTPSVEIMDEEDDEAYMLPVEPIQSEMQSPETQIALYTLLSLVPDSQMNELRQGMEYFGLLYSDEALIEMYEEAMKPTEASDDFVQVLFHEAPMLTSPLQITALSRRLAPFYSTTPTDMYASIQIWLTYCVDPLLELQRVPLTESLSALSRPCYQLPSGRWTLSDFSKTQYFGQKLQFLHIEQESLSGGMDTVGVA